MLYKTLKQCLREANALLVPPSPLPTSPNELAKRLNIELSPKHTKAELQISVGKRCLGLLVDIQAWLEKEYWPVEHRDGLEASDFLLGTADLRSIRSLCSHAVDLLLLPLCIEFHMTAANATEDLQLQLKNTIRTLLSLMNTSPPPASSAGPSTRPNLPPTVVGQVITIKHLPYIYLSATLLAYAPTFPGPAHQGLRTQLLQSWQRLAPTVVISAIGTAIRLQNGKGPDMETEGWNRTWPTYVPGRLGWQMSAVVRRPGGIKAIMENIFGENAVLQGGRGVDTERLEIVARAVISSSSGSTTQWIPQALDSLLEIINPSAKSTQSPPLFINAACYTIFRIWSSHTQEATDHLDTVLQEPLRAYVECRRTNSNDTCEQSLGLSRAHIISALSIHTPFSPEFLDYLMGQNFTIFASIHRDLTNSDPDAPIEISTPAAKLPEKNESSELAETIRQILLSWARDVGLEDGVERISEASKSDQVDVQWLERILKEAERPDLTDALNVTMSDMETKDEEGVEEDRSSPSMNLMAGLLQDQLQFGDK